jgi:hypothetical protein
MITLLTGNIKAGLILKALNSLHNVSWGECFFLVELVELLDCKLLAMWNNE